METLNFKRLTSNFGFAFTTVLLCMFIVLIIYLEGQNRNPFYPLFFLALFQYIRYASIYILTHRKRNQIVIKDDAIIVYDSEIKLENINSILVQGYFNPIYGIQLKNKKFVSIKHQFKFAGNQIKHEDAFTAWAREHNFPLVRKAWAFM